MARLLPSAGASGSKVPMVSRAQDHAAAWRCGCHKTHFVVMGATAVGATLQGIALDGGRDED